MQEQKKYHVETEYNVSKSNTVFVVSNYYNDNTLTIWGFDSLESALDYKTRSDVGFWKSKCVHDWKTNITEQYQECKNCGIGHAL